MEELPLALSSLTDPGAPQEQGGATSASPEFAEDAPQNNIFGKHGKQKAVLDAGIPHPTRVWNGTLLPQCCCALTHTGEWMSLCLSSDPTETTKPGLWHSHADLGPV